MILSDLLGSAVHDDAGRPVGHILDVRFVIDGTPGQLLSGARLDGFVVSPHSKKSYLGYDRKNITSPAMIARFLKWMHRGTFYVDWESVASFTDGTLTLNEHHDHQHSPA